MNKGVWLSKKCSICGKIFDRPIYRKECKFCSRECAYRARKGRKMPPRTPEHCRKISENKKGVRFSEAHKAKLRAAWKPRNYSEEAHKKMSQAHSGQNNPAWRGGINSGGYSYLFKYVREQIRERNSYRCKLCGKSENELKRKLDVHHRDGNRLSCDPNNLVSLCRLCHRKVHRDVYHVG